MDLISVIVPVYKVEQYLNKCIFSLVNQSFTNLQIILVDDGTPDSAGEICDFWAATDSRIDVIHQTNKGGAAARNEGLKIAKGNYIAFVDSDDYIAIDMYEKLHRLINISGADIAECSFQIVHDDYGKEVYTDGKYKIYSGSAILYNNLYNVCCQQIIWNKLYKRNIIGENRFVEGKTIDDEFFTYKVLDSAKKVAVISDKLYFYRQQTESVMHQQYSIKRLDALEACIYRYQYVIKKYPQLSSDARINLWSTCMYHYQMILKYVDKTNRTIVIEKFERLVPKKIIIIKDICKVNGLSKFWFLLSKLNFKFTCYVRNLFGIGE